MEIQWHPKTAEIIFAVICVVVPWSFSDMPVVWRCILWAIGWALLLHLGFAFIPFLSKPPIIVRWSIALGMSAFLVAFTYSPIVALGREEMAAKTTGELYPVDSLPDVPVNNYIVQIGSVGTKFVTASSNHEPWIIMGDKITFRYDGDKLLFSTIIRDRTGNVIVQVNDNKWRVSNQSNVCWDKNYSRDTLEVLDGRGRVVLQIKLLTNGVQLQGEWHSDDGHGFRMVQIGLQGPQSGIETVDPGLPGQIPPITARFKYPSKEHWGESIY